MAPGDAEETEGFRGPRSKTNGEAKRSRKGLRSCEARPRPKRSGGLPASEPEGRQKLSPRRSLPAPRAAKRDRQGSRSHEGRPQGCRSAGGRQGAGLAPAAWKPKAPGGRSKTRGAGAAPEARGRRRKFKGGIFVWRFQKNLIPDIRFTCRKNFAPPAAEYSFRRRRPEGLRSREENPAGGFEAFILTGKTHPSFRPHCLLPKNQGFVRSQHRRAKCDGGPAPG